MTRLLSLFRRKPRWVPLHARPWRSCSYVVVAMHLYCAEHRSELA